MSAVYAVGDRVRIENARAILHGEKGVIVEVDAPKSRWPFASTKRLSVWYYVQTDSTAGLPGGGMWFREEEVLPLS